MAPRSDYRPPAPQGGCLTTLIVLALMALVAVLAVLIGLGYQVPGVTR